MNKPMSGLKVTMLENQIDELKAAIRHRASQTSQVMDMVLVALEEDEIDEAKRIIKCAMGYIEDCEDEEGEDEDS